jgi:phytoene synthase
LSIGDCMDVEQAAVEKSYRHCRELARAAGSNFLWALWMLPARSRQGMHALYAFARHTDDLTDERPELSPHEQRQAVAQWRAGLEAALTGSPSGPIFPALADAVQRHAIGHAHLFDLIEGVSRDLAPPRHATFAQLEEYCRLVASSVGLACLPIWGCRDERALAPATACGVAFQLTNILRDLREDAEHGRCYLPDDDLAACGISREAVLRGNDEPGFRRLMQLEIERAEQLYAVAAETERYLEGGPKRLFRAMFGTYRGLLQRIASEPAQVLRGRIRIGWGRRLAIAAGAWWGR